MSPIQCLSHIVCFIFTFSLLMSKYIEPINHSETKEILNIYKKDREYSRLIDDKLVYFIEGPVILNIRSRNAFPSQSKKSKAYQFEIIIDEEQSLLANHNYRKDPKVYSANHPGHSYTLAGIDVLNIPKGQHRVELVPIDEKNKILIRATTSSFKAKNKISEIRPVDYKYMDGSMAILKKNNEPFYMLSNNITQSDKIAFDRMMFQISGPCLVRITSRTTFEKDNEEYYQFKIRKNDQLVSTHHMFSKRSDNAKIINKPFLGVSKWKSTQIKVPSGAHEYEIELVSPKEKNVLFKIQKDVIQKDVR